MVEERDRMIRTYIFPCKLRYDVADSLNMESGHIYSHIVSKHWQILKKKDLWLSPKGLTKISDMRNKNRKIGFF